MGRLRSQGNGWASLVWWVALPVLEEPQAEHPVLLPSFCAFWGLPCPVLVTAGVWGDPDPSLSPGAHVGGQVDEGFSGESTPGAGGVSGERAAQPTPPVLGEAPSACARGVVQRCWSPGTEEQGHCPRRPGLC